jgi:RNA polymerase sigma-70 factor (ECF subfamily)
MAATTERATLVLDLFDRYYERVYAFLRKSTTPDVAEDLAQEVFLRLLQHPELERLTISISYLLKIAHNLLRRRYARATRLRELLEERAQADDSLDSQTPGARRTAPEPPVGGDILETALGLLGKDEQDAIRLIVCEGKSYQHAAEALGVSVTTINNWKHRGIVKLRTLVQGNMQGSSEDGAPGLAREPAGAARPVARTVEISTQPVRLAPRRQGRIDAETVDAARPSSIHPGGGAASAMQRSLLAWRAARDEVA